MRQLDAYLNPSPTSRDFAPLLVVLSSHHLRHLNDVIVAPAVTDASRVLGEEELEVGVDSRSVVLVLSDLFSVPIGRLKKRAGALAAH